MPEHDPASSESVQAAASPAAHAGRPSAQRLAKIGAQVSRVATLVFCVAVILGNVGSRQRDRTEPTITINGRRVENAEEAVAEIARSVRDSASNEATSSSSGGAGLVVTWSVEETPARRASWWMFWVGFGLSALGFVLGGLAWFQGERGVRTYRTLFPMFPIGIGFLVLYLLEILPGS
ncbi:MAG: hypothetical protein RBS39_02505 [Phycisphaerales bacterium]|jgi:hypothetical protein|nr:hypothetical protein [Phycisphaerales bacterium]